MQMLLLDPAAKVLNHHRRCCPALCSVTIRIRRVGEPCIASRAFSSRFSTTCCSLPSFPWMRGRSRIQLRLHTDLRGLELVVKQRQRIVQQPVQIDRRKLRAPVREKFSSPFTISDARNVCCVIFSSTGPIRLSCSIIGRICLASICV